MLIHSLWIGSLFAGVLILLDKLSIFKTNDQKHFVFRSTLVLFLISLFAVFKFELSDQSSISQLFFLSSKYIDERIVYWLFSLWFIGFILYSSRFFRSYLFISEIKKTGGYQFPEQWHLIFSKLKEKLNLPTSILFIHSRKVQSAFVYGIIKPMVVIPTSWVNKLSYSEAECILAHELSHLKAGDHIFNFVCHLSDLVFFFNPAAIYITSKIKFHRELCADDHAVQILPNLHAYASLILKLGEDPSLNNDHRIVAFATEKNQLLKRVKNLLKLPLPSEKSQKTYFYFILSSMISIILLTFNSNMENLSQIANNEQLTQINPTILYASPTINTEKKEIVVKKKAKLSKKKKNLNSNNDLPHDERLAVLSNTNKTKNIIENIPNESKQEMKFKKQTFSVDTLIAWKSNQPSWSNKREFWEPMLIDNRIDLKKWIQLITEEALQSNLKNYRIISESESFKRNKEFRNKVESQIEFKNINIPIPSSSGNNSDGSIIN